MAAHTHRDLRVWQLTDEIRRRVFRLAGSAVFDEHRWLRSQLRRSAHSACANIAEGFARYRPLEFAHFLDVAKGSLAELDDHLDAPVDLPAEFRAEIGEIAALTSRAQGGMTKLIQHLRSPAHPLNTRNRRKDRDTH